jgi:hypothetical protein
MFPISQASDNAHLSNERMAVKNFTNGYHALTSLFEKVGATKASELRS